MGKKRKAKREKRERVRRLERSRKEFLAVLDDNQVAEYIRITGSDFLWSQEWRELRAKVIAKHGGRCMRCGYVPKSGINVDHIKPRRYFPQLALDESNLQTLCGRCNKAKGNHDMTDWRGRVHHQDQLDEEQESHIRSILAE